MKYKKLYLFTAAIFMISMAFSGLTKSAASDIEETAKSDIVLNFNDEDEKEDDILSNKENDDTDEVQAAIATQNAVIQQNSSNIEDKTQEAETAEQTTAKSAASKTVKELIWFSNGDATFKKYTTAIVTDVLTKKSFTVIRKGGTNHADVEPLTAKDTAIMKSIYGGKWSWDRRAVWVEIEGTLYAGSMNGMPHGKEIINNNNFAGHFCIHFTGSRTHATNRVDARHQAAIKVALTTKP